VGRAVGVGCVAARLGRGAVGGGTVVSPQGRPTDTSLGTQPLAAVPLSGRQQVVKRPILAVARRGVCRLWMEPVRLGGCGEGTGCAPARQAAGW
jgi:hypothetical protein